MPSKTTAPPTDAAMITSVLGLYPCFSASFGSTVVDTVGEEKSYVFLEIFESVNGEAVLDVTLPPSLVVEFHVVRDKEYLLLLSDKVVVGSVSELDDISKREVKETVNGSVEVSVPLVSFPSAVALPSVACPDVWSTVTSLTVVVYS